MLRNVMCPHPCPATPGVCQGQQPRRRGHATAGSRPHGEWGTPCGREPAAHRGWQVTASRQRSQALARMRCRCSMHPYCKLHRKPCHT
eukprot:357392-Chlamydomonas_euryale.AAC.29